ncbi:sensor histidine kinase [Paenilisteria rocourtiae]|uniref:histidine kinase n=1 Tax=Listeria rocourtiae TaxID=647910 RepID=A0A4V3DQ92_9LIST|nr:sensor histidine kinase [Listeria rocourtiae]EUJ49418.1 histidine kinase [Listeria rocourtiae FSL F6-920]MBC1603419.1 HAMP domain-containing histidine kinase [Listeria rocourtiae]TDR55296.1 signal transduction histidine kinase [Listeria rocourtiae]
MRLFLRSHISFLLFALTLSLATVGLFWLDGYKSTRLIIYVLFLWVTLSIFFLAIRYAGHRRVFKRLEQGDIVASEFHLDEGSPFSQAFESYLAKQYHAYQIDLQKWRAKDADRNIFINQWVHQMKTPVSVIELMTQNQSDPTLRSIQEETDRIQQGLDTVLYTLRLETFENDFVVERADLKTLASEAINEHKRLFIRQHLYPKIQIDSDLFLETDKKWFVFMLGQLLSNAIKYSPEKGSNIEIKATKEAREYALSIRDYGIGIEKADLARVFRPFFTGENGRKFQQSTGMGLFLVSEICNKLGYQISVESEIDVGTTILIRIPTNY